MRVAMIDTRQHVRYRTWDDFDGWEGAEAAVVRLIETSGARQILEIGSGAAPTLSPETVERLHVDYTTNDSSAEELAKASSSYETLLLDLSEDDIPSELHGRFDLVFSRMVNEHVRDGGRYYRGVAQVLRPGGLTAHWFSTLYAAPFVINRASPESLAGRLFNFVVPSRADPHERFKAYYSWSRGPSRRSLRRFEDAGFAVETYTGYFGHGYYEHRWAALHRLEQKKAAVLAAHPVPALCSYAHVVLRRTP